MPFLHVAYLDPKHILLSSFSIHKDSKNIKNKLVMFNYCAKYILYNNQTLSVH